VKKTLSYFCSLLITISFLLSACGSVFYGSTQDISFQANVDNVEIYIGDMYICTTPCLYTIDRMNINLPVTAYKDGYKIQQTVLETVMNPIVLGNSISPASWMTDITTGSVWKYRPDSVYFNMQELKMKPTKKAQFINESRIRHYVLYNFPHLQKEAYFHPGKNEEYIAGLQNLTQKPQEYLEKTVLNAKNEIDCINRLLN